MLIDTHAHLWFDEYRNNLDEVIKRAKAADVEKIIAPGTDLPTSQKAIELAKKYPGLIYAAVGVHPEEAGNPTDLTSEMKSLIENNRKYVVAVGEVGTDMHDMDPESSMPEIITQQKDIFREQCEVALEYDMPVIIHTRDSLHETFEVLDELQKMPRGQFHCFSYGEEELDEILKRGFYVSFCGNISWSKRLRRVASKVPADRLLLETDSPFMTPVDETGQKVGTVNEPGNVKISANIQAELRGMTLHELGEVTSQNANNLFGI